MKDRTLKLLRKRVAITVSLLLAISTALSDAEPAQALNIAFPNFPAGAVSGSSFRFSATVSTGAQEYIPVRTVGLYIRKLGTQPPYQAVCADLPLTTGTKRYSAADTGGGLVNVTATAGAGWEYSAGDGYGPGPASLTYEIVWYVPAGWLAGLGQVEVRLYTVDSTITQAASFSLSVPPPLGATSTVQYTNALGVFLRDLAVASSDGKARVAIPVGTKAVVSGGPISQINIGVANPSAPADAIALANYVFGPEGATFEPSVDVSITYAPSLLPEGVDERNLVMAVWNSGKWNTLTSKVDIPSHIVTSSTTQFGTFGVMAYTRPAAFTVSGLSITPAVAEVGKTVTVAVTVTNTGDISGNYTALFKMSDVLASSREVTLTGKASQNVTFSTIAGASGTYSVNVNGCAGTFDVRPASPPPPRFTPPRLTALVPPASATMPAPVLTPASVPNTTPASGTTPMSTPPPKAPASSLWSGWLPYAGIIIIGMVVCFALWKAGSA